MSDTVAKSLLCPIVIGRAVYLDALEQQLARADAGQGTTLLLAGEAGIGKSRLLKAAKSLAVAKGSRVLQGNCFETDRTLPYAPLLDLLRSYVAIHPTDALKELLRPYASEFLLLLPELCSLWPEITAMAGEDAEQDKRRLFQSLVRFFRDSFRDLYHSSHSSLVVVVEDLHWCDDSTLEFLLFFARQLVNQPILLLLSYRNDETNPALNRFLAALDRERVAIELNVSRLQHADTEAMISSIFEQPVRQEFAQRIHDLTEGNPFFIEETLKSLVERGDIYICAGQWTRKEIQELQIPRTVQVALAQRLEQLSVEARRIVILAAVAGRRFDFSLLQAITGTSESDLVQTVKELMRAQLVVEESADSFAFRHALTQQAIYAELLKRERRPLHRAIAEAIELLYGDVLEPRLAELSFHYACACDSGGEVAAKSYLYGLRAGERSQTLHAPGAAVEHFSRALDAANKAPVASPLEIGALLHMRGLAYEQLGDFEAARLDHERALAAALSLRDLRATWQAFMDLGMLWAQRDFALAGDYFRRALEVGREQGDAIMLAHTLKRLGNWRMNIEQLPEAIRDLNEALAIFERLEEPQGMAETLDMLGIAHFSSSNAIEGAACYERAIALFRRLGNRHGELASYLVYAPRHSVYINNAATWPAVAFSQRVRDGEYALQLAREMDDKPAETLGLIWLGNGLGTGGEYGRGLRLTYEGLALAEQIAHRHFIATAHMILGGIYWDMLLLEDAQEHLEQALAAAHESHSLIWLGGIVGYLASTLLQRGSLAEAEKVLNSLWGAGLPMFSHGQRQLWCARTELLLARREAKEALQVVDQLIASDLQAGVRGEYAVSRLATLRGIALTMMGQYAEAESTLHVACTLAEDTLPALWRLHLAHGNNFRRQNRRDEADQAYAAAREVLMQIAGTISEVGVRSRFIAQTNAQFPAATEKQAAKQAFAGLTAKERFVATLIAQGLSNKQIAEAMVVSHRTVETHVSNLLSKLHLTSRAQIARWAMEKGLSEL